MLNTLKASGYDLSKHSAEEIEALGEAMKDMISLLSKDPTHEELLYLVITVVAAVKFGEEQELNEIRKMPLGDLLEMLR